MTPEEFEHYIRAGMDISKDMWEDIYRSRAETQKAKQESKPSTPKEFFIEVFCPIDHFVEFKRLRDIIKSKLRSDVFCYEQSMWHCYLRLSKPIPDPNTVIEKSIDIISA